MSKLLIIWLSLTFVSKTFSFETSETVLNYLQSGYLFYDPVQPNSVQLPLSEYNERFQIMDEIEKLFVNASFLDFSSANYPDKDPNLTDPYQSVMTVLYNKRSSIYDTYYKFDKISNSYQSLSILIDPCRSFKVKQNCNSNTSSQFQTNNMIVQAGLDLQIAFYTNTTILHCSQEWQKLINCGSFIEIHRPFDPYIIEQIQISDFITSTYIFQAFKTNRLCAGKFELWYVVRTRIGVILQYTKPFFVSFPSCDSTFEIYLSN